MSELDDTSLLEDESLSLLDTGSNFEEDTLTENDEEEGSQLALRLKKDSDIISSVESFYSNYYNNDKTTMPYMSKFEKAKLLGVRAEMIASGDKPMVDVPKNISTAYDIALLELEKNKIPLIIRRTLPNGKYEDWRIEEMIVKN